MTKNGFYKFELPLPKNLFEELANSVDFEDVTKGRKGNHLVKVSELGVPIVRTTTKYNQVAHNFSPPHLHLVENIHKEAKQIEALQDVLLDFNNALIEIYEPSYAKMKYHSDQDLDLAAGSYIALFSCYAQADNLAKEELRKLQIKSKITGEEFEFTLENNSVILFSLETNTNFLHKIVLEPVKGKNINSLTNKWLGITFRQSATWIHFKENVPYFANGEALVLANETQSKEFYQLRGQENSGIKFLYPSLSYTLSLADTLLPKGVNLEK